jgi:hypothetical protein
MSRGRCRPGWCPRWSGRPRPREPGETAGRVHRHAPGVPRPVHLYPAGRPGSAPPRRARPAETVHLTERTWRAPRPPPPRGCGARRAAWPRVAPPVPASRPAWPAQAGQAGRAAWCRRARSRRLSRRRAVVQRPAARPGEDLQQAGHPFGPIMVGGRRPGRTLQCGPFRPPRPAPARTGGPAPRRTPPAPCPRGRRHPAQPPAAPRAGQTRTCPRVIVQPRSPRRRGQDRESTVELSVSRRPPGGSGGNHRTRCHRSGSADAARSRATDPATTRAYPTAIRGLRRCTARAAHGTVTTTYGASPATASTDSRRGQRRPGHTPVTIPTTMTAPRQ